MVWRAFWSRGLLWWLWFLFIICPSVVFFTCPAGSVFNVCFIWWCFQNEEFSFTFCTVRLETYLHNVKSRGVFTHVGFVIALLVYLCKCEWCAPGPLSNQLCFDSNMNTTRTKGTEPNPKTASDNEIRPEINWLLLQVFTSYPACTEHVLNIKHSIKASNHHVRLDT